jgi:hypothetical protein
MAGRAYFGRCFTFLLRKISNVSFVDEVHVVGHPVYTYPVDRLALGMNVS